MANEKRLIDLEQAKRATYEEIFWTESKQADVRHFLMKLPTVDAVEVVHGEWLYGERNKVERTLIVECSECGAMFNLPMFTFGMNYNYCPNCGAKMDGDGNV